MCLIALAHRHAAHFPLLLAANRDEDFQRPTHAADLWPGEPHILGGRDAVRGGSWLAVTTSGRFAAVTNLRGAVPRADGPSRGSLVAGFVRGSLAPLVYAQSINAAEYQGFHLLTGEAGGEVALLSGSAATVPPGVHAFSNAPAGEAWPKVGDAVAAMTSASAAADPEEAAAALLAFLSRQETTGDPTRDAFIRGERYGTRSSTVVVVWRGELLFIEQQWNAGGTRAGDPVRFRFRLDL